MLVTNILLQQQRGLVVRPVLEGPRLLGRSGPRLHGNSTMWVGPDGAVVALAMVEVNEVVEFFCSFGCEVLLCRELLLRLSNYRDWRSSSREKPKPKRSKQPKNLTK